MSWNFDGVYRLTGETVSNDSQYTGSVSYGLDPVGNRLSQSSSLHGISSLGFSYNADDQILGETYDANGNTTATGGKTFAYDSDNHLVSMNGGAVTMVYNGDGNRVAKTASGSTTRYLVDDLNPTGYAQVVEETVNGVATREYTYGLQRIDEDQIVNNAWTPSFYGYDGFGTVRQLTSLAGAVTDTYEYDAYGNEITHTGTTQNNYLYRGEQWDPDLNLYYLRARYYNPQTGRFMSRDPEDGMPMAPPTLHRYLYASGDPVNGMDPTGRMDTAEVGQIDLGIAARNAAAVYAVGLAVACELNTVASTIGLAFDPTIDKKTISPDVLNCSAKGRRGCGYYDAQIDSAAQEVMARYYELMTDPLDLFKLAYNTPNPNFPWAGTWVGHQEQFESWQRRLWNFIDQAEAAGCPVDQHYIDIANLPTPQFPAWK